MIDLLNPHSDLAVPDNAVRVGKTHQVTNLEMAMALKYAAVDGFIQPTAEQEVFGQG